MLPQLLARLPEGFNTYVEPFVGGGAMLFHILRSRPQLANVVACDVNEDLVNAYRVVKEQPGELIVALDELQRQYLPLDAQGRKSLFMDRRGKFNKGALSWVERAATLIFLNRTCFNGLYRVNSRGQFNVPHGRYARPQICDADTIMADSEALQRVTLIAGDFTATLPYCVAGSFVYFDPPYRPTSAGGFTSYSQGGFGEDAQCRLARYYAALHTRGCRLLLSNSDGAVDGDDVLERHYAAFTIEHITAPRAINSNPAGRSPVGELLIRNYSLK